MSFHCKIHSGISSCKSLPFLSSPIGVQIPSYYNPTRYSCHLFITPVSFRFVMTTDANWLTDYCQAKHTRAMHSLTFPFKILMRSLCPLPFHKSCQNLAPDYTVSKFYWNQLVGQNKCWKMKAKQMGKQTEKVSVWVSFPLGSSLRTMIRQVKEYLISTSLNLAFHYGLKDEEDGRNTLTFSSVMYFSALSTAFWRIRWRNACREKKCSNVFIKFDFTSLYPLAFQQHSVPDYL